MIALTSVPNPALPSNRSPSFRRKTQSRGPLPVVRAQGNAAAAALSSSCGLAGPRGRTRRPQNVDGEFFVDTECIDCDTCRCMTPDIFTRVGHMSAVSKQPQSKAERLNALQVVKGNSFVQCVYHCGCHSDRSFEATSYLLVHPDGNVLTDREDVADHEKWSKRLKCVRILHSKDVEASTIDIEIKLEGSGPWNHGKGIELNHTPGHTEGSVCSKPLQVLFAGDHFAMTTSGFSIYERYNRDSVSRQLHSVKTLTHLDFQWILPGHGRRVEFEDTAEKTVALETFVEQKLALHASF